jgi:hypothetical protein
MNPTVKNITPSKAFASMRRDIDHIEIKEPPIQELKKQSSCLRKSCTTSCGCLIIFIILFLLLLKFVAVPRPKELKSLPESFPSVIPIYDEENIEYITFLSGEGRSRILEVAGYLPKLILVPIFIYIDDYAPSDIKVTLKEMAGESFGQKFIKLMQTPVTEQKDTFEIKWLDLTADSDYVEEYYQTELKKNNFKIQLTSESPDLKQLTFALEKISGVLFIKDDAQKSGTDLTILTINLSEK